MAKRGPAGEAARLRQQAGDCLARGGDRAAEQNDHTQLAHELQAHQSELEVQNLELRRITEEQADLLQTYTEHYDLAPVGYLSLDAAGRISRANLRASSLLGKERSSLLGQPFQRFLTGESRIAFLAFLTKRFAGQVADSCVLACLDGSGTKHWIRMDAAPVAPLAQECRVTFVDISPQVETQVALSHSEALFRAMFTALPIGVTLTDAAGNILMTNPASETLLGISSDDLLRRNFKGAYWDILRPDGSPMPPVEYASVRALTERRRIEPVAMGVRRPDGEITWLQVTAEPAPGPDLGVLITYVDVSAQKRAQAAAKIAENTLRESEALFRAVVEGSPVALLLHREDRFTYLNPAALRLLKATEPSQLLGKLVLDRIHPEDRELSRQRLQSVQEVNLEMSVRQMRYLALDGTVVDVESTGRKVSFEGRESILVFAQDITEKKKYQDELARVQREQSIILESANVGISVVMDRRQVWVNPWMERTFGYRGEEMVGQTTRRLYADDEAYERMGQEAYPILAKGETYETVQRLFRKDGRSIWIHYNGRAIDPSDLSQGTLWILDDISRAKEDQDALRESEARFRAMFELNLGPKLIIDPDNGVILDANPSAASFYGYALEELRGSPISRLNRMPEEKVFAAMAQARSLGLRHFEFQHHLADGRVREVEVYSSPIPLGSRTVLYSLVHDITDRKTAEAALVHSEARFRQVFDASPCGMSVTLAEGGQLLQVNDAWVELLGWSREEVLGQSLLDKGIWVNPQEREALQESLQNENETFSSTITNRCKDGSIKNMRISLSGIRLDGQDCHLAVLLDHTELHRAEVALRDLNQSLEQRVAQELAQRMAQERALIHQSRLAAMGVRRHQKLTLWRHEN